MLIDIVSGFHLNCFSCWVDMLSKAATIVGVSAAVVGIWYTRSQIKGFRKELEIQAFQNRYQMFMEMDKILIENPKLKRLISNQGFHKLLNSRTVSDNEIIDIAFIEMVMNIAQLSVFQRYNDASHSGLNWVKELLQNESIREYWFSDYRCKYTADFVEFVNNEYKQEDKRE